MGVFWFEKVFTGVWGWGTEVRIGIVFVFECVLFEVTVGVGVGTDKEGVVFVTAGGAVGFLIGAAVATATGREGWAGIDEWLAIVNPCPIVTAAIETDWAAPKKSSFQYSLTTYAFIFFEKTFTWKKGFCNRTPRKYEIK